MSDQLGQRKQQTRGRGVGGRNAMMKAWLNLNGVATPDGAHPTGRRVRVLRTKIIGAAFALTGLLTAYFFIVLPIEEAKRNGVLRQNPFGLVIPVALLCWGVMILSRICVTRKQCASVRTADCGGLERGSCSGMECGSRSG